MEERKKNTDRWPRTLRPSDFSFYGIRHRRYLRTILSLYSVTMDALFEIILSMLRLPVFEEEQ